MKTGYQLVSVCDVIDAVCPPSPIGRSAISREGGLCHRPTVGKLGCLQSLTETWQFSHGQLFKEPWDDRHENPLTVSDYRLSLLECHYHRSVRGWGEGTVNCRAPVAAEAGNDHALQVITMTMIIIIVDSMSRKNGNRLADSLNSVQFQKCKQVNGNRITSLQENKSYSIWKCEIYCLIQIKKYQFLKVWFN